MRSFKEVLSSCGGAVRLGLMLESLRTEWAFLVSPALARRTRPVAYEEGVLIVSCSSPSAETALRMERRGILTALGRLGYPIKDIKAVRGGGYQERPIEVKVFSGSRAKRTVRTEPDPLAMERAEERLKQYVPDPEILRAMARAMALWSKSKGRGV